MLTFLLVLNTLFVQQIIACNIVIALFTRGFETSNESGGFYLFNGTRRYAKELTCSCIREGFDYILFVYFNKQLNFKFVTGKAENKLVIPYF